MSVISLDTTVFNLNNFDISQYNPCVSAWTCVPDGGCFEEPSGQYETQAECIAACDNDSSSNNSTSYLGKWKGIDETLRYLQFTSDSVLVYQFDSTDCAIIIIL